MINPLPVCLCAVSMVVDLEGIIYCIKQGDENGVQSQLQEFNKEVTITHTCCVMLFKTVSALTLPSSRSLSLIVRTVLLL